MARIRQLTLTQAVQKALDARPELLELNRLMMCDRHDRLKRTARHEEFRFEVVICRHDFYGFVATTHVNGRLRRYHANTPANAFVLLTTSIKKYDIPRMRLERQTAAMLEAKAMEVA